MTTLIALRQVCDHFQKRKPTSAHTGGAPCGSGLVSSTADSPDPGFFLGLFLGDGTTAVVPIDALLSTGDKKFCRWAGWMFNVTICFFEGVSALWVVLVGENVPSVGSSLSGSTLFARDFPTFMAILAWLGFFAAAFFLAPAFLGVSTGLDLAATLALLAGGGLSEDSVVDDSSLLSSEEIVSLLRSERRRKLVWLTLATSGSGIDRISLRSAGSSRLPMVLGIRR